MTVLARRTPTPTSTRSRSTAALDAGSDLVLLGHYHFHTQVAPTPGTPAPPTPSASGPAPADEPAVKGIVILDTTSGTVRHHPVPGGRPLRSYRLDAFGLPPPRSTRPPPAWPPWRTPRARWSGCSSTGPPRARRLLDRRQLAADAFAGALVVTVQVETDEDEQAAQLAGQPVTSLADEWDRYLASVPIDGYDRDRLAGMGRAYLQQVEEEAR